jgi:hypothetical protein
MSEALQSAPVSAVSAPKCPICLRGAVRSILLALYCSLRSTPFFFSSTPKTPLRVLCVIAFDTHHLIQELKPLTRERIRLLATCLDLAADQNAVLDRKTFNRVKSRSNLERLEEAGFGLVLNEHLQRIRDLESRRPQASYDLQQFGEVRLYREAIVREHLRLAANIAFGTDASLCRSHDAGAMDVLFRIVMQCQILDDLLDYRKDIALGLPSFLTACASPTQCLNSTREASHGYRCLGRHAYWDHCFPFHVALAVVSLMTRLALCICGVRLIQSLLGMPANLGTPARAKACDILR